MIDGSPQGIATADARAAVFELDLEVATPIPEISKPLDVLAEGLPSKNSLGNKDGG